MDRPTIQRIGLGELAERRRFVDVEDPVTPLATLRNRLRKPRAGLENFDFAGALLVFSRSP
jgi:hypothetical protein